MRYLHGGGRKDKVPATIMKPRIFIGSSKESKQLADAIHTDLQSNAECSVWTNVVFELSHFTVQDLMAHSSDSDFAIFVFSPDDIV